MLKEFKFLKDLNASNSTTNNDNKSKSNMKNNKEKKVQIDTAVALGIIKKLHEIDYKDIKD